MKKVSLLAALAMLVAAVALATTGGALADHSPPDGPAVPGVLVPMDAANACDGGKKIENPASGVYVLSFGTFTMNIQITVVNTALGPTITFVSLDPSELVTSMFVKGGPVANFYDYGTGIGHDDGLHSPVNPNNNKYYGLSHLCIFADKK